MTLGVLFQRRFWPAAQRIRAAIDDGTLGTPFLGHAAVLLHRDTVLLHRRPVARHVGARTAGAC